ncbi:MAG: translation initiation factor [Saprospiraceae bacterium]|nr:translation initiation factor [Saprospiraceae bacterium]MBP9208833.1 translation initiation factor [Saprospiraceae bacterium]
MKKSRRISSEDFSMVYSTNSLSNESIGSLFEEPQALHTKVNPDRIRVHLLRLKGGKLASIARGFQCSDETLQGLARSLKQKCGVGGSAKEGEIILQGDCTDKLVLWLKDNGYPDTKRSGG